MTTRILSGDCRDCIGIDLNPEYARMATDRITDDAPLFAQVQTS